MHDNPSELSFLVVQNSFKSSVLFFFIILQGILRLSEYLVEELLLIHSNRHFLHFALDLHEPVLHGSFDFTQSLIKQFLRLVLLFSEFFSFPFLVATS